MFQCAPSNLEFYFADIDFEDLHGLQDTAREVKNEGIIRGLV